MWRRIRSLDAGRPTTEVETAGFISFGLFFFALALRLVYLVDVAESPTFLAPIVDAGTYDGLARSLVGGGGFTEKFFWQPFFYPAFLSVVYLVTHGSIVAARVFHAVLGACTCVVTFHLAWRVFGRRIGVLAGLILALYGPLIFFDGELLATGWACFWSVALVTLMARLADHASTGRRLKHAVFLGLGVGLSILTRPTFLLFAVAGGLWLAWTLARRGLGKARTAAILATAVVAAGVVMLPVAELHRRATGAFSVLPMSDGLNLYIGNNPDRAETISIRPGWEWDHLTRLPQREGAVTWQQGREIFRDKVKAYVTNEPTLFLQGLAAKAVEFVSSREIPRNVDVYLYRKWSWLLSGLVWKAGGFGFPFGVLLPLAFLGFVHYRRRIPGVLLLFPVVYGASIVLVFMSARYRMPLVPLLTVPAAGGCYAVGNMIRARRWGTLVAAAFGCGLVVAVSSVPGPFAQERTGYEAEMYYILGSARMKERDHDAAERLLARAVKLDPAHASAANHLGLVLERTGNTEQAKAWYLRAIDTNPEHATAHVNLANILWREGRLDDAALHYRRALKADPNEARAHNGLGAVMARQGRLWEAVHHFKQALRFGIAGRAGVLANVGTALCELGEFDEGIGYYRAAVREDPEEAAKPLSFVDNLARFGRTNELTSIYREALRGAEATGNVPLARRLQAKLRGAR